MKPKQLLLQGVADVAKVCSQTLRTSHGRQEAVLRCDNKIREVRNIQFIRSTFFQNVGTHLPDYKALYPRRQ
jgi:hypothetical protein